ncbi:MAG: ISL3 family transposase [Syntrophothermus sp.]|uniref:ISL3 family transposase n=1 Tax=Syntrophothermus sp. TaxID=2736299 RepID=UPI00257DCDB7|nr:ISL3 family transposase [Syntrophothermus sp.]NSW83667.1 ISL3 family transposase [Syntrophothermus sp.]
MSNISITSLFPFRRLKFIGSEDINFEEDTGKVIELKPDMRFTPICSKCRSKGVGNHSNHQRFLRDLSLGPHKTLIHLHYRKIECPLCGQVVVEELDIAEPGGPRVTKRLAVYIQELCKLMTVKDVAEHLHLDWKTVKEIDKQGLKQEFAHTDYNGLRYLAVDEISYGKHHRYLTTVIDFETGRIVWVGKDRKYETLKEFFLKMPEEAREQIKAVAMDMWDPFIKAVSEFYPKAAIVFDVFHIVAQYNKVIDEVRRAEARTAMETDKNVIKGSHWILLKNPENLKEKEIPRLEKLLSINKNLSTVYILKDELKTIWQCNDRQQMSKALDAWCAKALESGIPALKRFVKTLRRYKYGILNYADYPIHTSKLEGINNKIKVIKRQAYGFHDLEYFILKIKQACSGEY